jgi:hypothetical protein
MWGVVADVLSQFVPEQRDLLYLSFTLADANRLEHMLASAGFREVRVERVQREDTISSFDEYWNPIEAGMGSMPQVYVALPETERRATVRSGLSAGGGDLVADALADDLALELREGQQSLMARLPDWSIGRQRSCGMSGGHCTTLDRPWASVVI